MRRRHIVIAVVVFVLFSLWVLALSEYAGDTDPTNPPGGTSSYTLEDIYNRLTNGTAGTQSTFTEPMAGPGTPTMHTLNDIMEMVPVADNTDGATKADVAYGKKYWSLRTDGSGGSNWGEEIGSLLSCCTCTGTLVGTRWCDNGDGTVTDLLGVSGRGKCLVWLKKADWGGRKKWRCSDSDADPYDDAHTRAGVLCPDSLDAGLSDGSQHGDWRLPTKLELAILREGTEGVRSYTPRAFTGVQSDYYWSSNTNEQYPSAAICVDLGSEFDWAGDYKYKEFYVWPVRGGQVP